MSGVLPATVEHLLSRQGDRIYEVLDLIKEDVSLAEPIDPHLPYVLSWFTLFDSKQRCILRMY